MLWFAVSWQLLTSGTRIYISLHIQDFIKLGSCTQAWKTPRTYLLIWWCVFSSFDCLYTGRISQHQFQCVVHSNYIGKKIRVTAIASKDAVQLKETLEHISQCKGKQSFLSLARTGHCWDIMERTLKKGAVETWHFCFFSVSSSSQTYLVFDFVFYF